MSYGNLADSISEEAYQMTKDLSDEDYCDCLQDVIDNLQSSVDAKKEEMELEK